MVRKPSFAASSSSAAVTIVSGLDQHQNCPSIYAPLVAHRPTLTQTRRLHRRTAPLAVRFPVAVKNLLTTGTAIRHPSTRKASKEHIAARAAVPPCSHTRKKYAWSSRQFKILRCASSNPNPRYYWSQFRARCQRRQLLHPLPRRRMPSYSSRISTTP